MSIKMALSSAPNCLLWRERFGTTTFAEYGANVARLVENVYLPFGVRVVATQTICEEQAFRVISQHGNRHEEWNLRRS